MSKPKICEIVEQLLFVIASEARQSLDCFVAGAPRNDKNGILGFWAMLAQRQGIGKERRD